MAGKIFPLTPNLTLISKEHVLNKKNGSIIKIIDQEKEIVSYFNKNNIAIESLNTKAEVVGPPDTQVIDFYLKTSDGKLTPKDGFLIEVFASGSDGKLTRLYQEDLQDPVDNNNILQDGFSNYFTIEVD